MALESKFFTMERLFEKSIIFIPLGDAVDMGDYMGKFHLSDKTQLHINKFVEYAEEREDLKKLFPEKTFVITSDLPQGDEVVRHLKELVNDKLKCVTHTALSFDYSKGGFQKNLIAREIAKISQSLLHASVSKYEFIVLIGDNTFPFIMDK